MNTTRRRLEATYPILSIVWPRAANHLLEIVRPRWINGRPLVDAMAEIVNYHGCSIIVHSGVTMDGRVLGSYEIMADSPETVAAFAGRAITRLHTIVETCDESGVDQQYLVEMAKCEIDFVLETSF